jgi:hypothetical protein
MARKESLKRRILLGILPGMKSTQISLEEWKKIVGPLRRKIKRIKMLNREAWLTKMAKLCEPLFEGFRIGGYRVSCGFPSRGGLSGSRMGECHSYLASVEGVCEIFISPTLDDPVEVAGVLVHEMAHVVAGNRAGHGPHFARVARHAGLTCGSPQYASPGRRLLDALKKKVEKLGPYPHGRLLKREQAGRSAFCRRAQS